MSVEKTHEEVAQSQNALIPDVVDRLAHGRGSAKYGEWVTGSSVVSITYLQLANVINGLAWWLVNQLGPGSHEHPEVLTYVGPNDVRYSAMVLAAVKAGYVVGLSGPPPFRPGPIDITTCLLPLHLHCNEPRLLIPSQVFVTSPRNSPAGHQALFAHLQCQTLITTNPVPPPAQTVIDAVKPARHLTVPSLDELLNTNSPPYVLDKTFEELRRAPFVVM